MISTPTLLAGTKALPQERTSTVVIEEWHVILLNDEVHSFDEVIVQLLKATRCSLERAQELTWQIHNEGEAKCYSGPLERCEHVASILEQIELKVRLEQ